MGEVIRTEFGQVFEDDEDFEIEVSDLRTGSLMGRDRWRLRNGRYIEPETQAHEMARDDVSFPEAGKHGEDVAYVTTTRSPFAPYLTQKQRARRITVSVSVVLAALIAVTLAVAPFLYAGLKPTAAQPLQRGADRFYFVPNVPWGIVLLDGSRLTHLPLWGADQPLRLARGHHTIEWLGSPFIPFHCKLSVPRDASDTCATQPLIDTSGAFAGSLITEHESLLSVNFEQLFALRMAVQSAVASVEASDTVAPGELYRYPYVEGSQLSGKLMVADKPLKATISYIPLLQSGVAQPCVGSAWPPDFLPPCRAPGQDCRQLCTLSAPRGWAQRPNEWLAAIMVRVLWSYTSQDGKPLVKEAPNYQSDLTLIVLRITWNGTTWNVRPAVGEGLHLPASSDAACSVARDWMIEGVVQNLMATTLSSVINGFYSAAANAAQGCVVTFPSPTGAAHILPPQALPSVAAVFLERFGVLLAANDAAHALWPTLPQATAAERAIAQSLARGWDWP